MRVSRRGLFGLGIGSVISVVLGAVVSSPKPARGGFIPGALFTYTATSETSVLPVGYSLGVWSLRGAPFRSYWRSTTGSIYSINLEGKDLQVVGRIGSANTYPPIAAAQWEIYVREWGGRRA